jgi:hypothetical protein
MAYQAKYLSTPGLLEGGKVQLEAASVLVPTDPATVSLLSLGYIVPPFNVPRNAYSNISSMRSGLNIYGYRVGSCN